MTVHSTIQAEAAERAALADLHRAAPAASRERLGLALEVVNGVLLSMASARPSILVNRVVGLGVDRPAARTTVETIVERYRAAGVSRYFLQLDPDARPEGLEQWLTDTGLKPYHRAWAKFTRGTEPAPEPRSDLEVREIGAEHASDFGRIAAIGFELDEEWTPVLAGLVGRAGWHIYLSFDGGVPAGCGAMRVHDGVAWLDWAATLPEFRRRGSQGAVISRRLADGIAKGCTAFATSTGEAADGDAQHSFHNIERYGFRRTHARANWVPQE